jgi:hypothetical protein
VERFAARRMAQGWFDDEELITLLCRFYECTDWRLESSLLFYSKDDYERFYAALTSPIMFEAGLLDEGSGQEKWSAFFLKYPFDLGMQKSKVALWDSVCQREFYWNRLQTYRDLRAANLFQYLVRAVNVASFSKDVFFFNWEREFRVRLEAALRAFQEALERALRRWQEERNQKRSRSKFRTHSFREMAGPDLTVQQAMALLELDAEGVTLPGLRRNFRRLSKKAHPDQGGSDESFRLLATCREIVEAWIRSRSLS